MTSDILSDAKWLDLVHRLRTAGTASNVGEIFETLAFLVAQTELAKKTRAQIRAQHRAVAKKPHPKGKTAETTRKPVA